MEKIIEVIDTFNVRPQPKHFAAAQPGERRRLLRYIRRYLKACEKQDTALPTFRVKAND